MVRRSSMLMLLKPFFLGSSDESPRTRWVRRVRNACIGVTGSAVCLWIAAQTNPRVGPAVADGLRAVFGPGFVAWAEDVAYGAQDTYNGWKYKDSKPKEFWAALPTSPILDGGVAENHAMDAEAGVDASSVTAFPPKAFAPPFAEVATKADGQWFLMEDDVEPSDAPVFAKSLVHPDTKRPYAAVAVVAIDLTRVSLNVVAGTDEPASETVTYKQRPGRVPQVDHARLLATFNGGWQAVHGHFGMMVDGLELLPPKDKCCTVALLKDGSLRIAQWPELSGALDTIQSYRQTPPCLRTQGSHHELLKDSAKNWGAAVDGSTVIRRSAIGLNKERTILYYGVGDSLTGLTLAEAMGYVGAEDAAELDVNWAFPRFLTYEHKKAQPTVKESLIQASFKANEYVGVSWYRDFFYLTRKGGSASADAGTPMNADAGTQDAAIP
jgi:hypothetical protein